MPADDKEVPTLKQQNLETQRSRGTTEVNIILKQNRTNNK